MLGPASLRPSRQTINGVTSWAGWRNLAGSWLSVTRARSLTSYRRKKREVGLVVQECNPSGDGNGRQGLARGILKFDMQTSYRRRHGEVESAEPFYFGPTGILTLRAVHALTGFERFKDPARVTRPGDKHFSSFSSASSAF